MFIFKMNNLNFLAILLLAHYENVGVSFIYLFTNPCTICKYANLSSVNLILCC